MKVKQITLGSSTLALVVLLTACGGSSSSGVQKPTHLVGHGHHDNHGTTNPVPKWDATVRYASLKKGAEQEAIDYVKDAARITPKIDGYALTINGRTQNGDIDLSKYAKGHHKFSIQERVTGSADGVQGSITRNSDVYLFKQDYSLITGVYNKNVTTVLNGHTETKPIGAYFLTRTRGTLTEKLPTTGKFNYSGSGKVGSQSGVQEVNFNYNVDFGAKTGSGSLGNITLLEGNIKNHVIDGKATAAGSFGGHYRVGIFGPDADEIAGKVELGNEDVGGIFGGTKQAK